MGQATFQAPGRIISTERLPGFFARSTRTILASPHKDARISIQRKHGFDATDLASMAYLVQHSGINVTEPRQLRLEGKDRSRKPPSFSDFDLLLLDWSSEAEPPAPVVGAAGRHLGLCALSAVVESYGVAEHVLEACRLFGAPELLRSQLEVVRYRCGVAG